MLGQVCRSLLRINLNLKLDSHPSLDLSTGTMESALRPLTDHLTCEQCQSVLKERIKNLVVQWSIVKVRFRLCIDCRERSCIHHCRELYEFEESAVFVKMQYFTVRHSLVDQKSLNPIINVQNSIHIHYTNTQSTCIIRTLDTRYAITMHVYCIRCRYPLLP